MTTIDQLNALDAECPGCHGNLRAEEDDRWASGFSWYCPAPECTEDAGCWPVPVAVVAKLNAPAVSR